MPDKSDNRLNVPIDLLPDLSAKDLYLFRSIDQLNNRFDDVERKTDEQTAVLNQILTQSKLTNGRVTKNENDIKFLQKELTEMKPNINKVKIISSLLTNKMFWVGIAIVLLVLVPMVTQTFPPGELIAKIFGL